jgi:NAD-dependent dihydropyrimidine dehydrogenase PreA subunit
MKNLLEYRMFGGPAASRSYPFVAQVIIFLCFALLIAGGLAAPHVSARMTGTLRNTNLAALIVWSLWWPLVIISAVLFGRVWCQICPMELVNSLVSRIGLKRAAPRFLTSGWGVTLFYSLALLGFIRTFWANRYPDRMAFFFLFLLASAVIMGLLFEKRAFCNYLCPVGRLLGLYGCCAFLEWRVGDPQTCQGCRSKDCVDVRNAYKLAGRGCTSNLYPPSIDDNRSCHICMQCRKVCPQGNLRLSLRKPMADFFIRIGLTSAEFFLLFLASGLVVWEIAEEWTPARNVLEFVPNKVSSWLGFSGEAANFIHTLVLFALLPTLIFLIPGLAGKRANRISLLESAKAFSLMFLPVVALTHLVKALFRITSRLPYYPLAFKDPVGYTTANLITSGDVTPDMGISSLLFPWASWVALPVLAAALASAWLIGLKSPAYGSISRAGRIPYLASVTLYSVVIIVITISARF